MQKIITVIIHFFFWLIYCIIAGAISFNLQEGMGTIVRLWDIFLTNWIWATCAFYVAYFFIYRMFEKRMYVKYASASIICSLCISASFFSYFLFFRNNTADISPVINSNLFFTSTTGTFILMQCGSLLRGFISWTENNRQKENLEKENLKNELNVLKSQINPHFLFNTLNNIDSLIYTNQDKASETVIILSELLRYMLYEGQKEEVALEKEIAYTQKIVFLEKIRLSETATITFTDNTTNKLASVAPLLFIVFVENAFKHSKSEPHKQEIHIAFDQKNDDILFTCTNSFSGNNIQKKNIGGIGLYNVKRRLDLLYKNKHHLCIGAKNGIFQVSLLLKITNNNA